MEVAGRAGVEGGATVPVGVVEGATVPLAAAVGGCGLPVGVVPGLAVEPGLAVSWFWGRQAARRGLRAAPPTPAAMSFKNCLRFMFRNAIKTILLINLLFIYYGAGN